MTEVPAFTISYADRFAIPMLTTRKLLLEEHCLMAEAREVMEQIQAISQWQMEHLGLLTPLPGTVPANIGPTDDWR